MRGVAVAAVPLLTLLLLVGCEDRVLFVPAPEANAPTDNPPATAPVASFTQDPQDPGPGVLFAGWSAEARNELALFIEARWAAHPTSADLLFHVDPAANAEITSVTGNWCGSPVEVLSTGQPGEWRIQRSPGPDDCTCPNPAELDWGGFALAHVTVTFHEPGTWRVAVDPASATPACDCVSGCPADLVFSRGMATIPAPSP